MNGLRFLESVVPMPLFPLPVRSILVTVKNANGSETEVLISPGSKIERTRYDGAWKISDIVAPNLFHHAGVPKALALYPNARTWGVVGLRACWRWWWVAAATDGERDKGDRFDPPRVAFTRVKRGGGAEFRHCVGASEYAFVSVE